MPTRILITDDSALARKQLARCLPLFLNAEISFAENGLRALSLLKKQDFDLMFLDLTMPEMDGFETLEIMRRNKLSVPVFVVSGDIQPKAQQRVLSLGANAFIKKPITQELLSDLLIDFKKNSPTSLLVNSNQSQTYSEQKITRRDIYLEVVNVAMGRAADSLARYFDFFVHMPLPQVNEFEVSELIMAIEHLTENDNVSGVCQGFSAEGIAGEALLLISDPAISEFNKLLQYSSEDPNINFDVEALMDVSNILNSAFLNAIGEQAGFIFAQSAPVIIGQHIDGNRLRENIRGNWKRTLTIEVSYTVANTNIKCDLLFFLLEDSLPLLDAKLAYLLDENSL